MSEGPTAKKAHLWERDKHDWYVEPMRCTEQLLTVERFSGMVHDPSCGQGNIVTIMRCHGYHAVGTDIVRRVPADTDWFEGEVDFLDPEQPGFHAPNFVMNPPFFRAKGAEAFIRKALNIASGKVAVFVDVKFLAGGGRANGLFKDFPPHRVWILTPRPSCPPGEVLIANNGLASGGTADWCWLVWDRTAPFYGTTTDWLRRGA